MQEASLQDDPGLQLQRGALEGDHVDGTLEQPLEAGGELGDLQQVQGLATLLRENRQVDVRVTRARPACPAPEQPRPGDAGVSQQLRDPWGALHQAPEGRWDQPPRAAHRSTNHRCSRSSPVTSGWKAAARISPWRTTTG